MAEEGNGTGSYMTVREMVMEIREDVKELKEAAAIIPATQAQLRDHEARLRRAERWVYGIPLSGVLALGGILAALIRN